VEGRVGGMPVSRGRGQAQQGLRSGASAGKDVVMAENAIMEDKDTCRGGGGKEKSFSRKVKGLKKKK